MGKRMYVDLYTSILFPDFYVGTWIEIEDHKKDKRRLKKEAS